MGLADQTFLHLAGADPWMRMLVRIIMRPLRNSRRCNARQHTAQENTEFHAGKLNGTRSRVNYVPNCAANSSKSLATKSQSDSALKSRDWRGPYSVGRA